MEANKILNADFLDILFEGKNKSYGAYQLRKTYNSRMLKALAGTGIVLALILIGIFVSANVGNKKDTLEVIDASLAEVKKDEPPPPPPPPPPPTPPPPPEIKSIQYTPPIIKKDNEVKKDEKIEEIQEDQAISTATIVTENTKQIVQAPVVVEKSDVVALPKEVEEDKVFQKVEIDAEFPGGLGAWRKFLERNLTSPEDVPPGTYQVIVRFIVSKDGSVSDVVAETNHGHGMEQEAVRVIKKGPKWTPAQQNGSIVKAFRRQPITFQVSGDE